MRMAAIEYDNYNYIVKGHSLGIYFERTIYRPYRNLIPSL